MPGITAVVGPNGCGKSNIGDAINWVLGEQSPRMLRGRQMADVIFAGSEGRKPVGLAEVSLHLQGAEGLEGAEQGQVVVTRRLFRSGESEYLLNGRRTRLKDIQELLDRGHVGARTYATIEQGRIDQILNAKPRERRLIIEDAAGIAGYKHKRRLTELKLEATEANLLRVNDIVVEVERQIRSLKRQASRARRYRRLRDELRGRQRLQFGLRARQAEAVLAELRGAEQQVRDREAGVAAELARRDVALGQERAALEGVSREYRDCAEHLHRLELDIDRNEAQVRACRERIAEAEETGTGQSREAEQLALRLEQLGGRRAAHQQEVDGGRTELGRLRDELEQQQQQVDRQHAAQRELRESTESLRREQFDALTRAADTRNRLRAVGEALGRVAAQRQRLELDRHHATADLSRLEGEATDLETRGAETRRRLAELRAAADSCETRLTATRGREAELASALAGARAEERSAAARVATLEDVATRFAGVSDGVRTLLTAGGGVGLRTSGVVADFIEAGAEVESAAEGYLRGFLPTVIVEDDEDVRRAAMLLREHGAGRTGLISRSQPAGGLAVGTVANGHGALPGELLAQPGVRGRLSDRLTLRASGNGVVQERIGDALLVDDLETALDLHRRYPTTDYITAEGEVVYASGVVVTGGNPAADRGLLAHQRRLVEARTAAATAAARVEAEREQLEQCRVELERLENEMRQRRAELEAADRQLVELDLQARRSVEDREKTGRRTAILADELQGLIDEARQLEASRSELATLVEQSQQTTADLDARLSESTAELERGERELAARVEQTVTMRETLAAAAQRQQALEHEAERLTEAVGELEARVVTVRAAVEAAARRGEQARQTLAETERTLAHQVEERQRLEARAAEMQRDIERRQAALTTAEARLREMRQELDTTREATREAEVALTRAESSRAHLDELCRQELGQTADAAATQAEADGADWTELSVEALEQDVQTLRDKVERIGPVNMTALDEFAELEERHGFLTAQRQDLEKAMTSLKESIRRINRSSRERFVRAFDAIRASYQEIFKLLFNGGRADLQLEEGEDVLECGIEILAQPPGKRLANINLLSGGEKALSAIALLFSVFRHQPSPFCLLDEVDAALDDVNVGRFTRMLGEYAKQTQFIIVTHNKLTMESANLLYGVTMEEPGVSKLVSLQLD